ncbi:MAG TPA: RNA polymerase sigma factor [Acidobacteriota bacterium]|nr:RNA polymerase sigma factor [Acidobacteriota bacterium]
MESVSDKSPAMSRAAGGCGFPAGGELGEKENGILDEELVERSLRGEEDAFRRLYERYRKPVYSAACRILPDREEARDVTQEIFIAVYRSLATWNPRRARFLPWIRRVAINRSIDHRRTWKRRAEVSLDETPEPVFQGPSCNRRAMDMENRVDQKERVVHLWRCLDALPQTQRRFVVLRYCDGLKLREIAEREGCRLGTVKSVLHRATHTLRLRLMRLHIYAAPAAAPGHKIQCLAQHACDNPSGA